jgi:hypothetical protein
VSLIPLLTLPSSAKPSLKVAQCTTCFDTLNATNCRATIGRARQYAALTGLLAELQSLSQPPFYFDKEREMDDASEKIAWVVWSLFIIG